MITKSSDIHTDQPWLRLADMMDLRHHIYDAYGKPQGGVYQPFLRQWREYGISLMLCSGKVPAHEDANELPPFCYHAVLLNDAFLAKGPDQRPAEVPPQSKGRIFELNIHKTHHLVRDQRIIRLAGDDHDGYPGWASLCFNREHPISFSEANDFLNEAVAKIGCL